MPSNAWGLVELWLSSLAGLAPLCFENAEAVLRNSLAQVLLLRLLETLLAMYMLCELQMFWELCGAYTCVLEPHGHEAAALLACVQGFRILIRNLQELGVRVLITSRCHFGGLLKSSGLQLHLSRLAKEDAVALLRNKARSMDKTHAVIDLNASKLVDICCCTAVAVAIIGGLIACGPDVVTAAVRPDCPHIFQKPSWF